MGRRGVRQRPETPAFCATLKIHCMPFLAPAERESTGVSSGSWPFTLRSDERCFSGHFDDTPVLPGIAHVAIALEACARLTPVPGALVGLDDLRFLLPLAPADTCVVALAAEGATSVRFQIRRGEALASSGVLRFAAAESV